MQRSDTEILTPYVPRLAVDWLREQPEARHRRIAGTLAFVDISGFTRMTERLARRGKIGAEEVNDVLDRCFTRLLAVAYDAGGSVLKWGGDAVLVWFGGPGHAARACRSAHAMRATLRQLGRLRTSAGLVTLRMSVGIHSADFDFFLVGRSHRELLVTGPAATRTVAMEMAAQAGEIVISSATAALLPDDATGKRKGDGHLLRSAPPAGGVALPPKEVGGTDLRVGVPVELREHLLSGGGETEHRQVVPTFVRYHGVDRLLAREGPDAAADALDQMIRSVEGAAEDHGVTFLATDIDRDGGKIILVAGAPRARGEDADRMLRAARAIADGGGRLPLAVGVHAGRVVGGDFGPPYRRTYTIIGDAVNLAARLMAKAEPRQVLATEAVMALARTRFEARPLEPFHVKGKRHPVRAFELGSGAATRAGPSRAEVPLVGRDRELGVLLEALESARQGEGRIVDVVAEPGMGKSRLLAELRTRAGDAEVASLASEPYETSTPYGPFRRLLRGLLGIGDRTDPVTAGEILTRRTSAIAPRLGPWLPLVATVVDAEVRTTPETEQLELDFKRTRLEAATDELLGALLPGTTVLMFEDVHWLDEASGDLLTRITSSVPSRRWLLCVSRRRHEGGFLPPVGPKVVPLELQALSGRDAAALAAAATELSPLSPQELAAVAERSGGNPLFLQELVAVSRGAEDVAALPETIEGVLAAEIDRLPASDRTLLRSASVLGARFSLNLLQAAIDGLSVDEATVRGRLGDFLEADPYGGLRFRHALVRDAAYEGLPYRRRRELHERVATTIERTSGPAVSGQAELLSFHFHAAARHDRSWRYSRLAGERARGKFANVEAAEFYRRAVEAAQHLTDLRPADVVQVLSALGDVSERAGRYRRAAAAYREARRRLSGDVAEQASLLLKEGLIRERAGRYSDAVRWYGRAMNLLEGRTDRRSRAIRAAIAAWYASSRKEQGRWDECIRWCLRAIDDAREAGARAALAHADRILGNAYAFLGRADEAKRYRELALKVYEEIGDLVGQSETLNDLGIDAYFAGRWGEALDLYRRASDLARRTGDEVNAAHGTNNIAEILSDQGRLEEAEALFREVLRTWRAAGFRLGIAFATSNLGRVAARAGRYEEAMELYQDALAAFRGKQAEIQALETEARIAEAALLEGRAEEALRLADRTLERVDARGGQPVLRAMLLRIRGWALARCDPSLAPAALEESLELARSVGAQYEAAQTLRAMAALDRDDGSPLREEAASILRRLDVVAVAEPSERGLVGS